MMHTFTYRFPLVAKVECCLLCSFQTTWSDLAEALKVLIS